MRDLLHRLWALLSASPAAARAFVERLTRPASAKKYLIVFLSVHILWVVTWAIFEPYVVPMLHRVVPALSQLLPFIA